MKIKLMLTTTALLLTLTAMQTIEEGNIISKQAISDVKVLSDLTPESVNVNEKVKAYILAFDCVWKMDPGLNGDIKYICINTKSFKDFSEEDKKQLFNYISEKYHVAMLDMNYEELKDKGYIIGSSFKEGILFEISDYGYNTPDYISFEGMKYRTEFGAIGFTFEAQKIDEKWEIKICDMTWIR